MTIVRKMSGTLRVFLPAIICSSLVTASAILPKMRVPSVRVASDTEVEWSGEILHTGVNALDSILERNPTIQTLRITQSNGGVHSHANDMFDLVNAHDLKVVVTGLCASACAELFLAARRRELQASSGNIPTHLHIHGTYRIDSGELVRRPAELERASRRLAERTQGKFDLNLYRKARNVKLRQGGLKIYLDPQDSDRGKASVFFCEGTEYRIPQQCEPIFDKSVESLGVITPEAVNAKWWPLKMQMIQN